MFDALEYNYKTKTYFFDLVRREDLDQTLQGEVYFMKERFKTKMQMLKESIDNMGL